MKYKYYLDSNLINEPEGYDKFVTNIKRDKTLNGIFVSKDIELKFGANEYNYFKNKIDVDGYCGQSEIIIEKSVDNGDTYSLFHNGIIYYTDISFDEKRKECSVKVQDNSFYAYINNNIDVGSFLYSDKSKNGVGIFSPPMIYINCFRCSDGVYFALNPAPTGYEYRGYLVHDVFKHLIAFMSDNKVQFKSDTFDVGGIYHDYLITTGTTLRYSYYDPINNPAGIDAPTWENSWEQISFKKFYEEIHKRFNLMYWIEYINGVPTFRIEEESYGRKNLTIPLSNVYIDELSTEIDNEILYSKIVCGNGAVQEKTGFTLFDNTLKLIGFNEEEFSVLGQCNLDNALNLKSEFIHDSNVIQNCLEQGYVSSFTNEYDKSIFIIHAEYDSPFIYNAVQSNWITTAPPYFYNETLINSNIVERFYNGIPQSLAQWVSIGVNEFVAYRTPSITPLLINATTNEPVRFDDDSIYGNDPANVYGNGTSTPVTQGDSIFIANKEGNYVFKIETQIVVAPDSITTIYPNSITYIVRAYDAGSTFMQEKSKQLFFYTSGYYYNQIAILPPIYLDQNWYVRVDIVTENWGSYIDDTNGYIKFYLDDNKLSSVDINKIPAFKFTFKIPMDILEFEQVQNNITSLIPFRRYNDLYTRYGWIKSLKYNHKDNLADIVLISSKENINGN